jgi:hypothetical protein
MSRAGLRLAAEASSIDTIPDRQTLYPIVRVVCINQESLRRGGRRSPRGRGDAYVLRDGWIAFRT